MIVEVSLNDILPNPWQTRRAAPMEHIKTLAMDIAANGLLQNPVGRLMIDEQSATLDELLAAQLLGEIPEGCQVQLAFGHNRLAAYKWLNHSGQYVLVDGDWSYIPIELKLLSDEQMANFAWSENEKRRELSPIERAQAIAKRIDDFGWSHEDAGRTLGISRPVISNALRLLKLPDDVQALLHCGRISERQAMALLKLFDYPEGLVEEHVFNNNADYLVTLAMDGESSESIRKWVDNKIVEWDRKSQPQLSDEPAAQPLPEPEPQPTPSFQQPRPEPVYEPIPHYQLEPDELVDEQPEPFDPPAFTEPEPEIDQPVKSQSDYEPVVPPAAQHQQSVKKHKEPSLEQSTIDMAITLWPYDGDARGRVALLAVSINGQNHIMKTLWEKEITLPIQLVDMLVKLSQDRVGQS